MAGRKGLEVGKEDIVENKMQRLGQITQDVAFYRMLLSIDALEG